MRQKKRRYNKTPMDNMVSQTMNMTMGVTAMGITAGMSAFALKSLPVVK